MGRVSSLGGFGCLRCRSEPTGIGSGPRRFPFETNHTRALLSAAASAPFCHAALWLWPVNQQGAAHVE